MTNSEIDTRLKSLSRTLPELAKLRYGSADPMQSGIVDSGLKIAIELELMNMSMMAIFAMLGEIAKRLPENPKT